MDNTPKSSHFVILIAPSISEQMGGEAIRALQIYQSMSELGVRVHQVTHSRVRDELTRKYPDMNVSYVEDDRMDKFLVKFAYLDLLLILYFYWRAIKVARELRKQNPRAIIHYTSPVSPVVPVFALKGSRVVVGPLDGNIHYPPAFRSRESSKERLRRFLLKPAQWVLRTIFSGKKKVDIILVAGGERTLKSLKLAGCRDEQFRPELCSGIPNKLRERPIAEHHGANFRFVHNGRLVPHKGTDLAIRAVARTKNPVHLDVIGRGPTRDGLMALAKELNVEDRVHFIDWFKDHDEMYAALRGYRGFVFPSLAEAFGIVVAEAMMIGLPVICADWGGPGILVTPETGIAIPPTDEETVIAGLTAAMDQLGENGELADRLSRAGRQAALDRGFSWDDFITRWIAIYDELSPEGRSVPSGELTSSATS